MAQQPTKTKKPVKNPPQYPNIIDLENKEAPASQSGKQPGGTADPAGEPMAQQTPPDALTQSLTALAGEMRTLVQEMRAMNLRQQAALDMLRMTRVDLRIDHYESELRPVRERIAALEAEEQNLYQLMTRDSLLAQSANIGTVNREQTMQQIKLNHEARLRYVQAEKERLRKVENDLIASLGIYQKMGNEAEQRIQAAEEMIRQLETVKEQPRKESIPPQTKP
jgi:hypothetical protein